MKRRIAALDDPDFVTWTEELSALLKAAVDSADAYQKMLNEGFVEWKKRAAKRDADKGGAK